MQAQQTHNHACGCLQRSTTKYKRLLSFPQSWMANLANHSCDHIQPAAVEWHDSLRKIVAERSSSWGNTAAVPCIVLHCNKECWKPKCLECAVVFRCVSSPSASRFLQKVGEHVTTLFSIFAIFAITLLRSWISSLIGGHKFDCHRTAVE